MAGPDLFDVSLRIHGAEELGRNYIFVRLARMQVAGHLDYSETSRILERIRRKADWVPVWMDASDNHADLAEAAANHGADASAGDGFLRASLCAHWASLYATGTAKSDAHARSLELYSKGAGWFEPPVQRVEVPFSGDVLPGYLRVPRSVERPRLVLMIGGADTNKEELHHWGTQFTRRGFAVLPFDGPGQGELSARYDRLKMRFDTFHRAVEAVISWVQENHPEIDAGRVGVFGNSLGGYLALDAGIRDERVQAVICNGGFSDARSLDGWPDGVVKAFSSCLGIASDDEVREHVRDHLDLRKVESTNRPISLVIHGGKEDLSEEGEARDAARLVDGTLAVVTDGWHTCTNRDHLISPLLSDWMGAALNGQLPSGFREIQLTEERDYASVFATS